MQVEQTIASDDSLLPAAQELMAYQQVNEDIIPWLLKHTALEQEKRHTLERDKVSLIRKSLNTDRLIIIAFFVVVLIFIGLSAWFVYLEKNIEGSLFGIFGVVGVCVLYKRFLH